VVGNLRLFHKLLSLGNSKQDHQKSSLNSTAIPNIHMTKWKKCFTHADFLSLCLETKSGRAGHGLRSFTDLNLSLYVRAEKDVLI
jgi:hypothetical protein